MKEHINTEFPWRVVVLKSFDGSPSAATSINKLLIHVDEMRKWCIERFRTGEFDESNVPLQTGDSDWMYRGELGGPKVSDGFHDVFYFRHQNDAFEFKLRWC